MHRRASSLFLHIGSGTVHTGAQPIWRNIDDVDGIHIAINKAEEEV